MGSVQSKKEGVAIAGSTSLATTGAGITLMVVGGPAGVVAGSIILGAGISGTVATTQQALNDKEKFDYKRWGLQTTLGAAGGAIAAPISIAGGAIAGATSGVALTHSARIGIQIGADVTAGMAAGAGTKVIVNAVEGKELSDGVLQSALISGITGGVAAGATRGLTPVVGHVTTKIGRVAIQTTSGALVSGTTGALGAVLNNIMNCKVIDKDQFISYMKSCGASQETADQIWQDLLDKAYIVNNEFTQQCENGISLKKDLVVFEDVVYDIYLLSKDIWKDVWETAAHSAALGGVITGVTSPARVMHQRDVKQVNKTLSSLRKKDVRDISYTAKEHNINSNNLEDYDDIDNCADQWEIIDEDQNFFKTNPVHQGQKEVQEPRLSIYQQKPTHQNDQQKNYEEQKHGINLVQNSHNQLILFNDELHDNHNQPLSFNQIPQPHGDSLNNSDLSNTLYISFDDFMKIRRNACIDHYLRESQTQ